MKKDPTFLDENLLDVFWHGEHMVYIFGKNNGLSLSSCLFNVKTGFASNGTKHLKDSHKDDIAKLEEKKKKRGLAELHASPSHGFVKKTSSKKAKPLTKSEKKPTR